MRSVSEQVVMVDECIKASDECIKASVSTKFTSLEVLVFKFTTIVKHFDAQKIIERHSLYI